MRSPKRKFTVLALIKDQTNSRKCGVEVGGRRWSGCVYEVKEGPED